MFSLTYPVAREIIKTIKETAPNLPVVAGGVHPTVLPEFVLNDSGADAVVSGEGENIFLKIAKKEIEPKGIIKAEFINDIDGIPFPKYKNTNINQYLKYSGTHRNRYTLPFPNLAVICARGCPFKCAYCASNSLFGKVIRSRSVKNVMLEIDYLISTFGIKGITFHDDTFTINKEWTFEFCKEIKLRKIKWSCGSRVDTVNQEILYAMKNSGCTFIHYGIESGSDRVLKDIMNKGITTKLAENTIRITRKSGIGVINSFMFGLPGETEEDLKKTIEFIKTVQMEVAQLSIFVPLPGSKLFKGEPWTLFSSDRDFFNNPSIVEDKELARLATKYHNKALKTFIFSPLRYSILLKLAKNPINLFYAFKLLALVIFERLKNNVSKKENREKKWIEVTD